MARSIEDLRRAALEEGDELIIDGRRFNASRQQAKLQPPRPKPADPPTAPAEPAAPAPDLQQIVRAVVTLDADREAARLAAQQDQTRELVRAISDSMAAAVSAAPQPPTSRRPAAWRLKVHYTQPGGAVDSIDMLPIYE